VFSFPWGGHNGIRQPHHLPDLRGFKHTITIWVVRNLYKRGAIFLVDVFQGNRGLADSVNHLLVVGFYLINIAFVSLALLLTVPGRAIRNCS
jgi:hypothetical protein